MVVSDPDTGRLIATPAIGAGFDGAGFDPGLGLAFSSNGGDGTLAVVRQTGGRYDVQESVPTLGCWCCQCSRFRKL